MFNQMTLLITGGTGSFGNAVLRRFLNTDYVERLCEALPGLRESSPDLRLPQTPYLRWIASTGEDMPPAFRSLDDIRRAAASVGEELLREVESEVHPTDQIPSFFHYLDFPLLISKTCL